MNTVRFGIYTGTIWVLVSLALIEFSISGGSHTAWVELDFRPLTCAVMLVVNALGHGGFFAPLVQFAEYGLPTDLPHVAGCLLLSFIDGFVSGFLIAIFYNLITIIRENSPARPALYFGIAAGIVLSISSALLALTVTEYGMCIVSFDFTIRPLWLFFTFAPIEAGHAYAVLKESYILFPANLTGALWWALWGVIDGFVWGTILAYAYLRLRIRVTDKVPDNKDCPLGKS